MLRTRVISAVFLVVPVAVLLWLGGLPWLAGVVAAALVAVHELQAALRGRGHAPLAFPTYFLALALPAAAYADPSLALLVPATAVVIAASLVLSMTRRELDGALTDWGLSFATALYVALPLAYFVALRQLDRGVVWMLVALACTWACDSAAYVVGRAIGRRPFSPRLSPKKTWEGTLGGLGAATAAGLLTTPLLALPWAAALALGCAVGCAAIAGDLAESFIKRQLGVKDSGTLIPGHGGALDRLDSLLFAVPVVFYVAVLWGGR